VIEIYPNDGRIALPYFNRASYYYENKNYDAAINDFIVIANNNPNDALTLERIVRIYGQNKNDLTNAILYFEKAYQINPKSGDAIKGLVTAYGIKGEYEKSVNYSLKAIELFPNDPILLMNAAASYQYLGNAEKAAEYKMKAEELSKKK